MKSIRDIGALAEQEPLIKDIIALKPVTWLNPNLKKKAEMPIFPIDKTDMEAAAALWRRIAPYLMKAFPETVISEGKVESPLREITAMKHLIDMPSGRLFLKCDNELPIAGSIKARGGIFEVLHYAESLALNAGLVSKGDNYEVFDTDRFRSFFNQFTIGVGSTGNLGLSIGIISAQLGFKVAVYVSADAKKWKKDLLRSKGADVLEFEGDFSEAILAGRQKTNANPMGYFVDDENSNQLYIGYSVAAFHLASQLREQGITVDADHPLFVYSPCGVGGSPGGVAFGLKQLFGDHVHCFFVEPTHSPAVLLGLVTGEMSNISVQDVGIDNKTEADGLAVGRPSNFATVISAQLISGIYTIEDEVLYSLLRQLMDSENIFLEPSATAGIIGPKRVTQTKYAEVNGLNMKNATHIAWATGGNLVPEGERVHFIQRGREVIE